MTDSKISSIIAAEEAIALVRKGAAVVFLDVRFAPGKADLKRGYEEAHIAGAHFVDLPTQLQGKGGGIAGVRPLPSVEQLQSDIARWGISSDSRVIVYSNDTPAAAARAWFVLRWAGVANVSFLDGGLTAWKQAGGDVNADLPKTGGGDFIIKTTGHLPTATADEIAELISGQKTVLDARPTSAYAGDGSDRSGHIPGAISLPSKALLALDGKLLSAAEITTLLEQKGVRPGDTVGVYCGGGVAAALKTLVLRENGVDARLFVGSFSAWSADPLRPTEKSA